jgi:hypothetical protein
VTFGGTGSEKLRQCVILAEVRAWSSAPESRNEICVGRRNGGPLIGRPAVESALGATDKGDLTLLPIDRV